MSMPFVSPVNYGRAKETKPHRFAYDFGSVDPGMYAPAPEHNRPKRAPRRTLSYTIPLPEPSADKANSDELRGHVLGVNALALSFDQTHSSSGGNTTGGLLFSGGRDGVVKVWDLNFPLRRRRSQRPSHEPFAADSWEWGIDRAEARRARARTTLHASCSAHSDWINDIVVVNDGRTVVSASSDQTIRAWTPAASAHQRSHVIGAHFDYVKALAYSPQRQMVFSGGLDRKIKLWDIAAQPPSFGPIRAVAEFGDASESSSVYTLACNAPGTLVVSGSPEKVIRVWDPRARRQVTMLTGHTDHVRAVLLSGDSELVLSGSSDATVKLWSMRMRRCLSTFSQHNDSVWSLHSAHPRLQTFYSASRDGLITKTVGAGIFSDEGSAARRQSAAMSLSFVGHRRTSLGAEAEHAEAADRGVVCVALAKEPMGVVRIVAADETYVWSATKGTRLNRWRDVVVGQPSKLNLVASVGDSSAEIAGPRDAAKLIEPDDDNDNDDESGEVSQKSVIASVQGFSPRSFSDAVSTHARHHQRGHSASNADGLGSTQEDCDGASAVSPVMQAMNAERAVRESGLITGPASLGSMKLARPADPRSSSTGPISTVLMAKPVEIPRSCTGQREETSEALSMPESPLPESSLMNIEVASLGLGSPPVQPQTLVVSSSEHAAAAAAAKRAADQSGHGLDAVVETVVPARSRPDETIYGQYGLHRHKILDNRRQVLAQDTHGRISLWDIVSCCRIHEFPAAEGDATQSRLFPGVCGTDFEAVQAAIAGDPESVSSWCDVDTRVGALTVHLDEARVWNAEVHVDEVWGMPAELVKTIGDGERINIGQWMLKRIFISYVRARLRRGTLSASDAFRLNRWAAGVPGGAVVSAVVNPARTPQQPKPASGIAVHMNGLHATAEAGPEAVERAAPLVVSQLAGSAREIGLGESCSSDSSREESREGRAMHTAPPSPAEYGKDDSTEEGAPRLLSQATHLAKSTSHHHNPSIVTTCTQTVNGSETPTRQHSEGEGSSTGKFMDRLRSMRVRRQKSGSGTHSPLAHGNAAQANGSSRQSSASGLKSVRGALNMHPSGSLSTLSNGTSGDSSNSQLDARGSDGEPQHKPAVPLKDEFSEWAGPRYPTEIERTLALLQATPASWKQLYAPAVCPKLQLPQGIVVQVRQECFESSEPYTIYRSTIDLMAAQCTTSDSLFEVTDDALLTFELCAPAWLVDFLLFNRLPQAFQEPPKISFILSPANGTTLAPFPNPNARLVANRMLKAKKLAMYVVEKLALPLMTQPPPNYVNAVDVCARTYRRTSRAPIDDYVQLFTSAGEELAEREREALEDLAKWRREGDEYGGRPELYIMLACKGKIVSPKSTLATIKAYVWKSSSDVLVNYSWAEFVRKRVVRAQELTKS